MEIGRVRHRDGRGNGGFLTRSLEFVLVFCCFHCCISIWGTGGLWTAAYFSKSVATVCAEYSPCLENWVHLSKQCTVYSRKVWTRERLEFVTLCWLRSAPLWTQNLHEINVRHRTIDHLRRSCCHHEDPSKSSIRNIIRADASSKVETVLGRPVLRRVAIFKTQDHCNLVNEQAKELVTYGLECIIFIADWS